MSGIDLGIFALNIILLFSANFIVGLFSKHEDDEKQSLLSAFRAINIACIMALLAVFIIIATIISIIQIFQIKSLLEAGGVVGFFGVIRQLGPQTSLAG